MIPVNVIDNETGKVIGHQAFNDNLTVQEQINRILLAVIYKTQLQLTNGKAAIDEQIAEGCDDATLTAIFSKVKNLDTAITAALEAFNA